MLVNVIIHIKTAADIDFDFFIQLKSIPFIGADRVLVLLVDVQAQELVTGGTRFPDDMPERHGTDTLSVVIIVKIKLVELRHPVCIGTVGYESDRFSPSQINSNLTPSLTSRVVTERSYIISSMYAICSCERISL